MCFEQDTLIFIKTISFKSASCEALFVANLIGYFNIGYLKCQDKNAINKMVPDKACN